MQRRQSSGWSIFLLLSAAVSCVPPFSSFLCCGDLHRLRFACQLCPRPLRLLSVLFRRFFVTFLCLQPSLHGKGMLATSACTRLRSTCWPQLRQSAGTNQQRERRLCVPLLAKLTSAAWRTKRHRVTAKQRCRVEREGSKKSGSSDRRRSICHDEGSRAGAIDGGCVEERCCSLRLAVPHASRTDA